MAIRQLLLMGVFSLGFAMACGSDDDEAPSGGSGKGGTAGSGGASGSGGTSGTSGSGGAGGSSGTSGASGTSGSSGTSGAGGSAGQDGGAGTAGTGTDGGSTDGGSSKMNFFVSSKGVGDGTGNLGGLSGADQHCKSLAQAAGSTKTQWVAYLSVQSGPSGTPVNAKDRIGTGPWYNAKGETLAANLTALHPTIDPVADRAGYIAAKPADALFLTETGQRVPADVHDILTGSNADGTLLANRTCSDWTSAAANVMGRLGHSDTPGNTQFSPSWNSAHDSQNCSRQGLINTGGAGRIYCFATD